MDIITYHLQNQIRGIIGDNNYGNKLRIMDKNLGNSGRNNR